MTMVLVQILLVFIRIALSVNLAGLNIFKSVADRQDSASDVDKEVNEDARKESGFRRVSGAAVKGGIATTKLVIRILDICIGVTFLIWALLLLMIFIAVVTLAVVGFLVTGLFNSDGSSPAVVNNRPAAVSSSVPDANGSDPVYGSTALPAGMDQNDWNKANDIQKSLASTAITASIMPFPGSSGNTNNGHLVYQQGNTPVGYYDCSTFVAAVLESNGLQVNGGRRSEPLYDFKTMKKSNLKAYMVTSEMVGKWKGIAVTNTGESGWEEKLVPGDIIVNNGHVAMYVGKNAAGLRIVAHAGSPSSSTFYDVGLTKKGKQVGLANMKYVVDSMAKKNTAYVVRATSLGR